MYKDKVLQKNPKEKLDFLIKQIEKIQTEMNGLDTLTQRIPKPKGNYVNIPNVLKISKMKHNEYQNHIRDLVKLHVDLNKEYKKQSPKAIELITLKFRKRNPDFPDTINNWAIKMMVKRVINNIHKKKGKEQENKKMNQVSKRSKNKESADHDSHDNSDTNIGQDNGSSNEVRSDKNQEGNSEKNIYDKIIRIAENSHAKNSSSNEEDKFIKLLKNKSDNTGEESTNPNEIVEMKQKALPITHAKRKQIENEVNEVINTKKKVQKQNRSKKNCSL
ncbi:hypothetical protein RclHR1_03460001 [Rhizophagus clarus]|uniref:Uncharacterized protein n=1 Tax=Rhizophagus clarus TaxID=94130 RepID=A0A2Z6RE18_9GLOM|nr:hypothetical protein RclHR1_15370004 [Rhizophagus clarus]GBB99232.1 hypothetical protein RclHR1_03460001 [Rhizophagus clarus]